MDYMPVRIRPRVLNENVGGKAMDKPHSFIILNDNWDGSLEKLLMAPEWDSEVTLKLEPGKCDMFDLLVICGAFTSKGQARKNWRHTGQDIPKGFNEFVVGKKRVPLTVWNPIGESNG